jgi:hypothetical protein
MARPLVTTALVIGMLLLGGCSDDAFVDRITVVNDTDYPAQVVVADRKRNGWSAVTTVDPTSTKDIQQIRDQGDVWVFRFAYGGHTEDVELSRRQLADDDWRIEVPPSFAEGLRNQGIMDPGGG